MTEKELITKLKELNIDITKEKLDQLNRYYELLIEWNQKINLTSITKKEDVYLKHFYDSATIAKIINLNEYKTLCDIGSGAGFPGIVLKILYPNLKITLVDSLNKRIIFLNKVIEELDLKNIEAIHTRVEEYAKKNIEQYEIVTARAVAHLSILLEYGLPMLKNNYYFIAMKGNLEVEIEESNKALEILNSKIEKIEEFKLPLENSNRTLIKIKKIKSCPKKYPRKYSEIKKQKL